MSVLVTGGAGYIGSHMVWELLDHGEDVVVLDNLITGFRWAVAERATFVEGDIDDQQLVEEVLRREQVTTIIHFAGSVVVPESIRDPLKYYDNNTTKSRTLVQAAVNCGVDKFIFSSTAAVYAPPENSDPVLENAILTPMSPYGSSKLMTEMMIRDVANAHNLRYVMLRYFNVAGADAAGRAGLSTQGATHLIKLACETALERRDYLEVYGTDYDTRDGSGVRDFIHVSDLVNAHYYALNFLRGGGLKFTANCGYGRGYSVLEVIDAVRKVSGCDFEIRHAPRREGDIASIIANSDRLTSRLGWAPKHDDLEYIIATALAWEGNLIEHRKQA
ncbi:MAG: UDP-glucose 4-epimerase GalE [Hyphomicrobiales bacterium]|nr:UDP-glucose 4-epimerase GalE [Hyphomicrobiales bacterium]